MKNKTKEKVQFKNAPIGIKFLTIVIIAGGISLIGLMFKGCLSIGGNDNSNMAYIIAQGFVKDGLKSPTSANFPLMPQSSVYDTKSKSYVIKSYVDSKNSFNADIRTNFVIILSYNGGHNADPKNWTLVSLAFDNK